MNLVAFVTDKKYYEQYLKIFYSNLLPRFFHIASLIYGLEHSFEICLFSSPVR